MAQIHGVSHRLLDISFVRAVIERSELVLELDRELTAEFHLNKYVFSAELIVASIREEWVRLKFRKIRPSAQAQLRGFLSPRKVGESLVEDCASENFRHFHGLNESELWVDMRGSVLFSYLDQQDPSQQFVMRVADAKPALCIGKMPRKDYIALEDIEQELPVAATQLDRNTYEQIGECRDILTNFRPVSQSQYHLKQRMLRAISDYLYSTSHRVDWGPLRVVRLASQLPA
jgi:hypothetical protein